MRQHDSVTNHPDDSIQLEAPLKKGLQQNDVCAALYVDMQRIGRQAQLMHMQ